MPVAVKDLHMATSLTELRDKCIIDKQKFEVKSTEKLIKSAKKIYESAKGVLKDAKPDEELAYVFLYRAMELWQVIMKSQDCLANKKYFELMYGTEVKEIVHLLEEYNDKLNKRYAALENGLVSQNKEWSQYKLTTTVVPKKRKDEKNSVNETSNGIKPPSVIDQKCLEDYNTILDTDVTKHRKEKCGDGKFMECGELKERLVGFLDILIIDTRPREDYELSKIRSVNCVNIPGSSIIPGLSANKLGGLIKAEREHIYWGQRDQYEQVVLLDWFSEQKDVIPGSPLSNLHVILHKWDPDCCYKNSPLILNGGFERFLDTYPTFTTNPKIKCPERPISSSFIHLSEHNIEYPMNVLEEPKPSETETFKVSSDAVSPTNRPSFDRSTKPHQLLDRGGLSLKSTETGSMSSVTEQPIHLAKDQEMEGKKVPAKPTQDDVKPSETTETKERPVDKRGGQTPSSTVSRPTTPPRSEKHKLVDNKGDGDGDIHFERTKFETPTRGGLKRSASSPNINKLGDEELDTLSSRPSFDRNTKPKPSFDYMPRITGTDTIYMADSNNMKGRGLTGLKNLGNLCYMNSIMQCISHTEELTKELTRFNLKESRNGRQIASEVSSLLRTLWHGETRTTSCRNLKSRVGALRHSFSTMEQQDSHEFLTILVDWMHEDLNEPSTIKSLEGAEVSTGEKQWGEFRKKNNSVIVDLFYGQLKSTVTCDYCGTESVLFEPFSNLSIPLPSSQEDKDRTFTLQECLKLYLKGESISGWVCPDCKVARKATKKLDITRLPPVLIIHLKRFMNDMVGVGWCRKRMNMVDFPITDLNMKPFTHPESELRIHNYNLYAVSNHYGSMESGHYTAYCKNHILSKWFKFDDQDVSEISPSEVKSSAAYILFYESSHLESQSQRILD